MSGNRDAIAKVQPMFDCLGRKTWPLCDDLEAGNIARTADNLMITLAIEAIGEATALSASYGVKRPTTSIS